MTIIHQIFAVKLSLPTNIEVTGLALAWILRWKGSISSDLVPCHKEFCPNTIVPIDLDD
jgi:hypothetical protein